jgi:hypothetical protein
MDPINGRGFQSGDGLSYQVILLIAFLPNHRPEVRGTNVYKQKDLVAGIPKYYESGYLDRTKPGTRTGLTDQ